MKIESYWSQSMNLYTLLANQMPAADAVDTAVHWVMSVLLWVIAVILLLALIGTLLLLIAVGIQLLRALSMEINQRLGMGQSDPVQVAIVWFRNTVGRFQKKRNDSHSSGSRPCRNNHRT